MVFQIYIYFLYLFQFSIWKGSNKKYMCICQSLLPGFRWIQNFNNAIASVGFHSPFVCVGINQMHLQRKSNSHLQLFSWKCALVHSGRLCFIFVWTTTTFYWFRICRRVTSQWWRTCKRRTWEEERAKWILSQFKRLREVMLWTRKTHCTMHIDSNSR